MRSAHFVSAAATAAALPIPAFGQEVQKALTVTAGGASRYVIAYQAFSNKTPVANIQFDLRETKNLTGSIWAQGGDRDGREIDLTEVLRLPFKDGKTEVQIFGGVYIYPYAYAPAYTAGASISRRIKEYTVTVSFQAYAGSEKTTVTYVTVGRDLRVGDKLISIQIGAAHNTGQLTGTGRNPIFGSLSVPVGKGYALTFTGYANAGASGAFGFSKKF